MIDGLRLSELERSVKAAIADDLHACGAAVLLRQVLDNLLGDAWKFTGNRTEAVIECGATFRFTLGDRPR